MNRPGLCRGPRLLRGRGHDEQKNEQVCTGSPQARGSDGAGEPGRAWFAMGSGGVDRSEDRLLGEQGLTINDESDIEAGAADVGSDDVLVTEPFGERA